MSTFRGGLAYALVSSYASMMSIAVAVNLVPVFLTTLATDLGGPTAEAGSSAGLTSEQLGRIGSITFMGLLAGIALTTSLVGRLGPKPFAVSANVLVGVGLAVLGSVQTYAAVLVAVFIMGAGAGMLDAVLSPIVCALRPDRRASAMNWLHSFYSIGAICSILVASLALARGVGWRTISLYLAAAPVAVGLAFTAVRVPPMVPEGQAGMPLGHLCRRPAFLGAMAVLLLAAAAEMGVAIWLPAYGEKGLGFSTWTGGMALMVFSIMMAIGRTGAGVAGHWISAMSHLRVSAAAMAVLLAIGCFAPWPAAALAACMATGLAVSSMWPSTLAVAADRFPHGGAAMFGLLSGVGNLGCVVMPWVVGVTAAVAEERGGSSAAESLRWGLATVIVCPVAMTVLLAVMARRPADRAGG